MRPPSTEARRALHRSRSLARAANCRVSGSFSFLSRKFEKNDESGLDAESRRLGKKDRVSN
jgi:hypothetical protein